MINSKKSFTLVELLMSLVLLGIISWIGIAAMFSGVDTWGFFSQRKEILADARMAIDRMSREMRMIKDNTSVTAAGSSAFRFIDVNNKDITFTLSSGTISRTENGTTNGLLDNVTGLTFTYYDSNGSVIVSPMVAPSQTNIRMIRIEIALSKATSRTVNIRADVWPRSLK